MEIATTAKKQNKKQNKTKKKTPNTLLNTMNTKETMAANINQSRAIVEREGPANRNLL